MARRTLRRVVAGSLGAASLAALLTISAATASADEPNPMPSPTATPSVAPSAPTVDFPLRPGDQGALIKVLHGRLEWLGYSIPRDEILDGAYGPSTQRALTALQ